MNKNKGNNSIFNNMQRPLNIKFEFITRSAGTDHRERYANDYLKIYSKQIENCIFVLFLDLLERKALQGFLILGNFSY
jgi:hypothetical protein